MRRPLPLSPGDPISVVAPSGPFDADLLRQGLSRLDEFDIRVPEGLWNRKDGFFAGSDEHRLLELQGALDDAATRAVLVARGGYGIARLLPNLDWSAFQGHPKWLVGFSDVTALHATLSSLGMLSVHAPNGTTLSRASSTEVAELLGLLQGKRRQVFNDLTCWSEGAAQGPLFGGNLTVLFAEAAAGRLQIPKGAILFLEDVTETSYRIDRMLTALAAGGHLGRTSGIVLGEFVDCSPGKFGVPTEAVLRRNLETLGVPILADLPCGHGAANRPLLLGATARLDSQSRRLDIET